MKLQPCKYRHSTPLGPTTFLCASPRVGTHDDIVTAPICKICTQRESTDPPKQVRLPMHLKRGWPTTVAVVIPCHNYGRYLAEAIESVLAQTHPAKEIVVVDDSSTDNTENIAKSFAAQGVRYLRVDFRHSQQTRRAGFFATTAQVLCFLDGDDVLSADYLESGLAEFTDPTIGIVYSDVEYFGDREGRSNYPATCDAGQLSKMNIMHSGSMALRDALEISRGLDLFIDDKESLQDWLLWRRILADGWKARKQAALYRYRKHGGSMTSDWGHRFYDYFDRASLAKETITLFIPLAGRESLWPGMADFLERQTWPHSQVQLILMDTSQNTAFSSKVRHWIAECDYPDVRYIAQSVGEPRLADQPRRLVGSEVTLAMARIYNRMARTVSTDYVWIVEDDIVPPLDTAERLLRGFDPDTASVAGVYISRFGASYVCWEHASQRFFQKGTGLQQVGGNGFGCVIIRGDLLRAAVFTATIDLPAYDNAFYHRLYGAGHKAMVDWSVECDHLEQR